MQKKVKCLITIILSLLVIFSLTVAVSAIEPRFSETNSIKVILGFNGTTADCSVKIYGVDGTQSIDNVNITLKDSKGNVKGEWTNLSTNGDYYSFSKSVSNLTKGEAYTLTASGNINGKTKTEYVKDSHTETCPSK